MAVTLMHKFSTVTARGKRRTVDGELLVTMNVKDGRVQALNQKGNVMVDCSLSLWNAMLDNARGYVKLHPNEE